MNTFMAAIGLFLLVYGTVTALDGAAGGPFPIALLGGVGLVFVLLIQARQATSDEATIRAAICEVLA